MAPPVAQASDGAQPSTPNGRSAAAAAERAAARRQRNAHFLGARQTGGASRLHGLVQQGRQNVAARLHPDANLTAAWTALGPVAVTSATYGALTGRITAIALDPNDPTGNTVYLGTTGGGLWKSTNAAGSLAAASFTPLTDTLSVFSVNAGSDTPASLSIGAAAVQPAPNPVLLAGTGDPNDALDSYYGEGILRSADGGLTWTLADISRDGANGNHSLRGLATAGIAWSTATPTLAVAAMSTSTESGLAGAAETSSTPGLYYSTDAGVTWQMATIQDGGQIVQAPTPIGTAQPANAATSVVWDAARQRFYAAVRFHGYYASADGITWTRLANQPSASLTTANCPVGVNGAGAATCPILRGTLAVQPTTGDLYALTVDGNLNDQGLWQDLCRATSAGACSDTAPAFVRIDHGELESGYGVTNGSPAVAEGDYNLALAALPAANNGTILLAGTVDLYRCALAQNATACALRNTTNALNGCNAPAGVAPSQHALAGLALTAGGPLVLLGNDGGLWRSTDGVAETGSACAASDASHFSNLNAAIAAGGSLAEVVGFAQPPVDGNTLLAGLAENGSAGTSAATPLAAWPQLSAGEGGQPMIDPGNPANWLLTVGAGVNLKFCGKGANCTAADFIPPATIGAAQTDNDASLVHIPALLDPNATTSLLLATCRLWRGPAADGSTWNLENALSPTPNPASVTRSTNTCATTDPILRSLAAGGPAATSGKAGSTVLYAGASGSLDGGEAFAGHVFINKAANLASAATPWADLSGNPVINDAGSGGLFNPDGFEVSSLAIDPHDATGATVYAAVMGFSITSHAPRLYRSTDFGAHWLNVTSNLPDVPANSVVVDPNDANTVYLALDTGVYVTGSIGTCATADCWSPLGTGLPNAPVTQLQAAANMPVGDGRNGVLRAGTYGRGLWQTPLLTAAVPVVPALAASPVSLSFAATQVQTQSAAQTVTLTSTGNGPVTIASVTLSGDFVETDTCSGKTLTTGASCAVSVLFAPTATGARAGILTISSSASAGPVQVALNGTGTAAAAVQLSPVTLTFPGTYVGQSSAPQTITVTNTGGTAATLGAPAISTGFTQTTTCTATLAPAATCTFSIAFAPATTGNLVGTLTLPTSAGTVTATLTGSASTPAQLTISPAGLTFPITTLHTASAAQTLTVTNTGGSPATLGAAMVSGDFALSGTCAGKTLAANATCTLSVVFTPTVAGTRTGTVTLASDANTVTAALSGTGTTPSSVVLTPTALTFGATAVNQTSAAQIVTVSNTGGSAATLGTPALTGDFTITANTCGTSLASQVGCSIAIAFVPAAAGARTGTLTLSTDTGVIQAMLSGTGNAPATDTLAPTSLSFGVTAIGAASAAQTVTLTNAGDVALTLITAVATGDFSVSNGCGASLPAHSTCAFAVTFVPTVAGARTGVLTVTDQFHYQTVPLNGTGIAPAGISLTPTALSFGTLAVGATSAAQTATFTNNGGLPLTLGTPVVAGDFSLAANTCGPALAAGQSCTLTVVFTPTAPGARTGTITVTDSATPALETINLTGTGFDFTLAANGPTTVTVASGTTATFPMLLSAVSGLTATLTTGCTGNPAHTQCTVAPTAPQLGATTSVTATVQTGTVRMDRPFHLPARLHPLDNPVLDAVLLAGAPAALLLAWSRRRRGTLPLLAALLAIAVATLNGCGTGRIIPAPADSSGGGSGSGGGGGSGTPTASGSYNITISAAANGLTHTLVFTLVVQ